MNIENQFTVSAPVEEAWGVMLDLEKIAPCLPGASVQEGEGDEYEGTMTVKIGPITQKYRGTVKFEETDEESHRAVLNATGRDVRGQGTASATITSTMQEEAEGKTRVTVQTDMKMTGRAAQFGRGIAQDIAEKMLGQFAECLEQRLAGNMGETETADGGTASLAGAAPGANGASGGASAEAGAGAPANGASEAASSGQEEQPKSRKISQPDPEPLDLGEMSQDAVMKRVTPVLIGAGALLVVLFVFRRLRRN